ncbi:DUF3093 domain-containing protein [Streptomyces sp. NP160]|uniref:DUF3093 domain-containing protein n=1 Tax=Streptomyces sp. NP160 TaxID=2586637 RepID=UPI00111A8F04|nr:DUF3093 domain-containing protein [Streptomyces sp. NP160]TNM68900.1 DUF3093 domain-containing protein [Streptomyces sp. NP160]
MGDPHEPQDAAQQPQPAPPASDGGATGAGGGTTAGPEFSERLWPRPATWLLVPLAAAFGAATGFIGGADWVVVGGAVLALVVVAWLVSASSVVSLSAGGVLRVGEARVEVHHLTGALAARGERATALRGPLLDARTHLLLRGWVDPVVLVGLGDPEDPTPAWLFSCRHPEDLVAALAGHGVSGPVAVHVPLSGGLPLWGPGSREALDAAAPRQELGSDRGERERPAD